MKAKRANEQHRESAIQQFNSVLLQKAMNFHIVLLYHYAVQMFFESDI